MQVSKKAILDQIEFHVSSYLRAYLSVGSVYYEYKSASAYVHSLRMLFSHSKAITSACDAAAEQLDNIFLNGDVNDYSRRHAVEQPGTSCHSEPVPAATQVDWTAADQITEPDHSEVGCLDIPAVLSTTPAKPSAKSPGEIFIAHRWSMLCRSKKSRISRLPSGYRYTGRCIYSAGLGICERWVS